MVDIQEDGLGSLVGNPMNPGARMHYEILPGDCVLRIIRGHYDTRADGSLWVPQDVATRSDVVDALIKMARPGWAYQAARIVVGSTETTVYDQGGERLVVFGESGFDTSYGSAWHRPCNVADIMSRWFTNLVLQPDGEMAGGGVFWHVLPLIQCKSSEVVFIRTEGGWQLAP